MPSDPAPPTPRPWWVWLAIPVATAKRRDVWLKLFLFTIPFAVLFAFLSVGSFVEGTGAFRYRWLVVTAFALAVFEVALEVRAIRWTDRAGAWQR